MMMKLDAYSFRARLQPAFIIILPLGLALVPLFPREDWWQAGIGSLLGLAGFSYLLAQLTRDTGKAIEQQLWASWGGKPTTQLLRQTRKENNKVTLARRHLKLASLTGLQFPTLKQEQENPWGADEIYDSAVGVLRDKTRDTTVVQHQLIFSELVAYGFRRNLLAMKPAGIFCSSLGTLVAVSRAALDYLNGKIEPLPWICSLICALILVWWLIRINGNWVKLPAFAYAERLLESTEHL